MMTMPPPSCMVLHCAAPSDPGHEVTTTADGDGPGRAPLCAEHWPLVGRGEPWLWVPGQRLKGVGSDQSEGCILMGEELAGYGLVVDADVLLTSSHVYSPHLAEGDQLTTLSIDGRVFGANQHVSIELVLTPETAQRLKEALRFFRT
jgi:hypothetical protein